VNNRRQQIIKVFVIVFCLLVIPAALSFLAYLLPAIGQTPPVPKHYTELTFPPLPEVKLPDYTRFQLKNGMVVYLVEDHELPLVSGTALIRTGERLEPTSETGLADLTGTVMRLGGSRERSADELNALLEQRAAAVETGVDRTFGSASFSSLSKDTETVVDVFAEVLQQPAFPQDKLDLAKTQIAGAIARRNDEPGGIASREFRKLVYGESSPYARTVEYATLANINRTDLEQFYQQYFHPENVLLGIVGDFDTATMRKLIEAKFGTWKSAASKAPKLPDVSQAKTGGVFLVDQPQLTQSNILIGHLGGLESSPDYPALSVMNEVLNGFGGRLFNQVRSRQGLAYSVYAIWSAQSDYPGLFLAGGQTRSDATVPFIQSVLTEIEKIRNQPISEAELQYAKDIVLNSFIFNFQDPSQTLSRLLRYEYFGYPKDFIFQYRKGVEATTIADVQRVAKTYLQPNQLVTLVVGNQAEIQPPLKTLSQKVTTLDVTIPAPPQ